MLLKNKKNTVSLLLGIFILAVAISSYHLSAKDSYDHRSLSKSEIIEITKVSDEEKAKLEEIDTSYDEILTKARNDNKEMFETYLSHDKDRKLLFLADGGMTCGKMTDYNGILKKNIASYDSETDPNAVTYEEAIELMALKDARNEVNHYLGIPLEGE